MSTCWKLEQCWAELSLTKHQEHRYCIFVQRITPHHIQMSGGYLTSTSWSAQGSSLEQARRHWDQWAQGSGEMWSWSSLPLSGRWIHLTQYNPAAGGQHTDSGCWSSSNLITLIIFICILQTLMSKEKRLGDILHLLFLSHLSLISLLFVFY